MHKLHGFDTELEINQKSIKWLDPIITQWIKIQRDYLEAYEFDDSLYWYNERANISALAGATWMCSGYAMEEYTAQKGEGQNKKTGRIDLYLSLGDEEMVIEAKLVYLPLSNGLENNISKLKKCHEEAIKDIKSTMKPKPANQGLAITFILPFSSEQEEYTEQLNLLKTAIMNEDYDLFSWFHNQTGENLIDSNNKVFNSVAIIGSLHL